MVPLLQSLDSIIGQGIEVRVALTHTLFLGHIPLCKPALDTVAAFCRLSLWTSFLATSGESKNTL